MKYNRKTVLILLLLTGSFLFLNINSGKSQNILGSTTYTNSSSGNWSLGYSFTPSTNISVIAFRRYFGTVITLWNSAGTVLATQNVSGTDGVWTQQANLATPVALTAGQTYTIAAYAGGGAYYWNTTLGTTFAHGTITAGGLEISGNARPTSADAVRWLVDIVYTLPTITCPPIPSTITGTTSFCAGGAGATLSSQVPTGGTVTTSGGYRIHTFTSSGTFTIPAGFSGQVEVLVVAGGGGGGQNGGGGGGGGGVLYNSYYTVSGGSMAVTVGLGGTPGINASSGGRPGLNGGNSVFGTMIALGGGGGANRDYGGAAYSGGCGGGGGGGNWIVAGVGTAGQGNNGGNGYNNGCPSAGGGGGGAGSVGTIASYNASGNGGNGVAYSISGSSVYYAGGGGGGPTCAPGTYGTGGLGGGAAGGTSATANTGGGGGGNNGTGGSGIVIIRYPDVAGGAWSSSNTTVATINSSTGAVTPLTAGTTIITYITPAFSGCSKSTTATVTVNSLSTAPSSITGPDNVCFGETGTLTVSGGSLGTGASWNWYSGSCGGTFISTGSSISISPSATTTYFVRAAGTCNTTTCAQKTVGGGNYGSISASTTVPAGISYNFTPSPPGVALGTGSGLTINYSASPWPACVNWGLPTTVAAVNLYNMAAPGGSCTYNNLIFDAANAETNLAQGKACFTGTYNFYCVNTGGIYNYNDCRIRMRVVVTKSDGITALPLTLMSSNLILHAKENFIVKVFIEGYAYFDLPGCIWSGIDYYISSVNGGWPGVVDIYNSLHTDPNGSICTQFQPQWYTINSSTIATATPSPLCVGGTVNLTGSSTVGSGCTTAFYNWSGPNGFSNIDQNPSITNIPSSAFGTYTLTITDGKVCYGTANTSVTLVTPNPLSPTILTNGDFIWSGQSSSDFQEHSNWLVYNGGGFSVAVVAPQTTNNVVIAGGTYATCVSSNPAIIQSVSGFCRKLTIEAGASLTVLNSLALNVSGDWKNDGIFNAGTGYVFFDGTSAISGSSINTFHHLYIPDLCSLTGPAAANINVTGNWRNLGTFIHNSGTVTFNGTSVNQNLVSAGTFPGNSFYNLIINSQLEFDLYTDIKVDNDFTLINANQYNANTNDVIVYGNWTKIGGTYDRGDGEVTLAGSNKNIVINTQTNFHNLNITGSYTVTASGFGTWTSYLGEGGNIYISPTGTLNANNGTFRISGLWNNTGVFNKGTSTVHLWSNNQQEIRSGGFGFHNVIFENYYTGLLDINISQPLTISGFTNFVQGIVYFTNTGSLTFISGATTDGGDPSPSFVNGMVTKVGTNAFIFPVGEVVGSDAYWAPIGIAAPSANSTITAQYKFDVPHDDGGNIIENYNSWMMCDPSLLHHVSGVEYWKLTSDNAEPAVTLYWKDANRSQITNLADLCVAHYEDCDGPGPGTNTKWAYKGGDPNAFGTVGVGGSGYVTSTIPFNSYSPITFGTRTSSNPLPINLLSFNAVCENAKVNITWSTASETNNDFFTIQRSPDASSWEFVKSIPGGGNSNSTLRYSATDMDPLNGTSYYRLKQTNYNGQSEVFSPVSVICGEDKDRQSISYYPNPFTSEVVVGLRNINYEKAVFAVYDLLGKKVYEMIIPGNESENQEIKLDLHMLPAGVYSVSFSSDGYSNTSKIIKNY